MTMPILTGAFNSFKKCISVFFEVFSTISKACPKLLKTEVFMYASTSFLMHILSNWHLRISLALCASPQRVSNELFQSLEGFCNILSLIASPQMHTAGVQGCYSCYCPSGTLRDCTHEQWDAHCSHSQSSWMDTGITAKTRTEGCKLEQAHGPPRLRKGVGTF